MEEEQMIQVSLVLHMEAIVGWGGLSYLRLSDS